MIKGYWVPGILVSVLLMLPVLAYATPPDPTWVPGLWDDGDYDDVVILIKSTAAVADGDPAIVVGPVLFVIASPAAHEPQLIDSKSFSPNSSRAPPDSL